MSPQQTGKLLALLGALFLAHSAYSTYERTIIKKYQGSLAEINLLNVYFSLDLAYIKAVDEVNTTIPVDVNIVNCKSCRKLD
jgi:hypothetical protein